MLRRFAKLLVPFSLCCATNAVAQAVQGPKDTPPAYVLDVGDVCPHVVRFVRSEELQRLCSDGALANFVGSDRGSWLRPKAVLAGLIMGRPNFPQRVTLAISKDTVRSACKMIRFRLLRDILGEVQEATTDVAAKQAQRIITALKEILANPVEVDVVLTVDMPGEAGARHCLRGFGDGLLEEGIDDLCGVVMEQADDTITVRFDPGEFMADEQVLRGWRDSFPSIDEALVEPAVAALKSWRVALIVQVIGKRLRVRITSAADPGAAPRSLGPRKADPKVESLLTLSWDHGTLRDGIREVLRSWRTATSAVGSIKLDDELLMQLDVLALIDRCLRSSIAAGELHCSVEDGLRLAIVHKARDVAQVPQLGETGLDRLVPRHAEYVWLTSHLDLPRMCQHVLATVELGLALGSEVVAGLGTGSLEPLRPMARSLRSALEPLSRMLEERGAEGFKAGAALFVTTKSRAFDGGRAPGMEVPALALVGMPVDHNAAVLFTRAVGRAVASGRGVDLDSMARRSSKDPALDVPVYSLAWEGQDDFGLHMFMLGEHLVITTSRSLAVRIRDASEKRSARAAIFAVGSGRRDLTEIQETSGSRVLDLLRQGRNALYNLIPRAKRSRNIMVDLQPLEVPLHLVGHVRGEARVQGNAIETTMSFGSVLPWLVPLPDTPARLKELRDRLGEWPREWAAVRATGKGRWMAVEDTSYRFLFGRQGNYHNEIDGPRGLINTWNGNDSFTRFHNHRLVCRTGGEHLQGTWYFSQVMAGTWCRGMPNTEVQWCLDRDSGERFLLFRQHGEHLAHGVYLDPETGLPRECRALAAGPRSVYESATVTYEDYRVVDGVHLPHTVRCLDRSGPGDEYRVASWAGVAEVEAEDGLFVQEQQDDRAPTFDTAVEDPTVEMCRTKTGFWAVRVKRDDRDPEWYLLSITQPFVSFHADKPKHTDLRWSLGGAETIGKLRLGPAVFADLPAAGVNLSLFATDSGEPIRGVLGTAVFKRLCTELDLRGQRMHVHPPGHWRNAPAQPWVDVSMNVAGFQMPARVDGHQGLFHVDIATGYEGIPVEIYPSFVEAHRLLDGKDHLPWPQERYVLSTLKSLELSGLRLTNTRCAFTISSEAARDLGGMAGLVYLHRLGLARILIDGPGQRIALTGDKD